MHACVHSSVYLCHKSRTVFVGVLPPLCARITTNLIACSSFLSSLTPFFFSRLSSLNVSSFIKRCKNVKPFVTEHCCSSMAQKQTGVVGLFFVSLLSYGFSQCVRLQMGIFNGLHHGQRVRKISSDGDTSAERRRALKRLAIFFQALT